MKTPVPELQDVERWRGTTVGHGVMVIATDGRFICIG